MALNHHLKGPDGLKWYNRRAPNVRLEVGEINEGKVLIKTSQRTA